MDPLESIYSFMIRRDEFHDQLGRGIPKGSIVYIHGDPSAGKSVVCQRLAYGFLSNNYNVSIISTEMTVKDFINQMYSLDYKIAKPMLDNLLRYIPVYPLMGKVKNRENFLEKLMNSKQLFDSEIVMIDTFSSLLKYSIHDEDSSIKFLSFLKKLSSMDKVTIITVENDEIDDHILSPFISSSDVMLSLEMKKIGGSMNRSIVVQRFGSTEFPFQEIIGFKIIPKVGFVIEITEVG